MRRLSSLLPLILLFSDFRATSQTTTSAPAKSTASKTAAAKPSSSHTAAKPKPATSMTPPPLTTDDQKTIYALGLSIYRSLSQFSLTPAELDIVKRALSDAQANKPAENIAEWGPKIEPLARVRATKAAEEQKVASAAYLSKAAAEPGAVKTDSGMIYKETQAGTGPSPLPTDSVKVQYRGTLVDGTEFDSSYSRNQPAEFGLNQVIKCWTEGVAKMKVGGKATLVCPSNLAYGDQGRPGIPGGATLIFDIELLSIAGK